MLPSSRHLNVDASPDALRSQRARKRDVRETVPKGGKELSDRSESAQENIVEMQGGDQSEDDEEQHDTGGDETGFLKHILQLVPKSGVSVPGRG